MALFSPDPFSKDGVFPYAVTLLFRDVRARTPYPELLPDLGLLGSVLGVTGDLADSLLLLF